MHLWDQVYAGDGGAVTRTPAVTSNYSDTTLASENVVFLSLRHWLL